MAALAFAGSPSSPLVPKSLINPKIQIARGLLFEGIAHPRPHKSDAYVLIERGQDDVFTSPVANKKMVRRLAKRKQTQKRQDWADESLFEEDSLVDIIADEVGIQVQPNASPAHKRSNSARRHDHVRRHSEIIQRTDDWAEDLPEDLPYGDNIVSGREFQENLKRATDKKKPEHKTHSASAQASGSAVISGSGIASGSGIGSSSGSASASGVFSGSASGAGFVGMAGSAVATASGSAASSASSSSPSPSKWVNGATGLLYSQLQNGSSTVITSASNVYVVQGGGDTSNGDALATQILTQHNETIPRGLFWLVDKTGNFCTNNATNVCYITLGDGYNDSPYSLVPYDLGLNGNVAPIPMWSIDGATGLLSGIWANDTKIQFTQNNMLEGNGDIDAAPSNDTISTGFLPVSLYLR